MLELYRQAFSRRAQLSLLLLLLAAIPLLLDLNRQPVDWILAESEKVLQLQIHCFL